jgi:S1-C subfamily serine protease
MYKHFIQTHAAISHGDSVGWLIHEAGQGAAE